MAAKIADLALLGDCHSAALVDRAGRVVWACFPRFDSASVFAAVLDEQRGGAFTVWPTDSHTIQRHYLADTNVLVTSVTTPTGTAEITDCMPIPQGEGSTRHALLRRVHCRAGQVEVGLHISPRFEYGRFVPRFRLLDDRHGEAVGGADALYVSAGGPFAAEQEAFAASWRINAGETIHVEAAWGPSSIERSAVELPDESAMAATLEATVEYWRDWIGACRYDGEHADVVRRSALVLKALTYAPSGAVVAAPTTSLPEQIGGERNWDYRYTWIRDSTLTLSSLSVLGFTAEAGAFKRWLERTGAGRPRDLQIMYGICGERALPELELDHLDGHRDSRPVRTGNGAVKQLQLDAYGQLLEAAYLFGRTGVGELTSSNWAFLHGLADIVCERWREPDQGIWEIRDAPRHFVHSKVNCWLALDRAVRLAEAGGLAADLVRWRRERDAVRSYVLEAGAATGWFGQAVGYPVADAAVLLVPAVGLLPSVHPLVDRTIEVVQRDLAAGGLLRRYHAPDGLEGGEGAFLLCAFWLLDVLAHAGRVAEADALLDRLLSLANDVGLYAEEYDVQTGEHLGNTPQAFTHMALITSCAYVSAAHAGTLPPPTVAHDYTESALARVAAGLA